jgi:hypothetical protein
LCQQKATPANAAKVICVEGSVYDGVNQSSVAGDAVKTVETLIRPGRQEGQWCILEGEEDEKNEIRNSKPKPIVSMSRMVG